MKRYFFKSLRARLITLLVVPVILILLVAGVAGFLYARDRMIRQWNQSVTLQLERAAHEIEMRLSRPLELMTLFASSGTDAANVDLLEAIVKRLETLPGVVRVNLAWHTALDDARPQGGRRPDMARGHAMHFMRGTFARVSPPAVDEITNAQTVSMSMILLDRSETAVGNLQIVLEFGFLISGITASPWWQGAMACIVDRATGRIVLSSGRFGGRTVLGETGNPLEGSIKADIAQKTAGTRWAPGHPPDRVAGFHSLQTFPWSLVVFADGETILSPIINFRNGFMVGALILIALVVMIIHLNIGHMAATVRHLAGRAISVASGDYGETIQVTSGDEIGQLAESFNRMIAGLREKELIQRTFGRYIDPDFARTLLKTPEAGRLGGHRQEVAILMTDIRGFTPMTENLSPEDTIDVLNGYFSTMLPLIQQYRGIIVDFVGDGILAFFEPFDESLADTTDRCLQCAFKMHAAVERLNRTQTERHLPELRMGIGINCGSVVVGNIGSEARKKYGIVGAAVNVTQRIQGQAAAGEVVVPESVIRMVEGRVTVIRDFPAALKGVASAVQLFSVTPTTPHP